MSPVRARHFTILLLLSGALLLYINQRIIVSSRDLSSSSHAAVASKPVFTPPPPPSPAVLTSRSAPALPRNVSCIELSAIEPCLRGLQNPWPMSADWACMDSDRGVQRLASCPSMRAPAAIDWRAVAFGIPIHNSALEEEMLASASATWLQLVAGADVVLATDKDDPRDDARLRSLAHAPGVTTHAFRCPVCCSGGRLTPGRAATHRPALAPGAAGRRGDGGGNGTCVGVREGWAARTKVLHMLARMHTPPRRSTAEYDADHSRFRVKLYFFKVDADTLIHPGHLLPLLQSLDPLVSLPHEPLLLGLASCRSAGLLDLCHPAGGGGYALNPPAIAALARFVDGPSATDEMASSLFLSEGWLAQLDNLTYGGEDVAVALALKQTTGASVINIGGFHQHPPDQYLHYEMDGVMWPTVRPLSFHNLRDASLARQLFFCTFYHDPNPPPGRGGVRRPGPIEAWLRRCFTPSVEQYLATRACPPLVDADTEECIETPPNGTGLNMHSVNNNMYFALSTPRLRKAMMRASDSRGRRLHMAQLRMQQAAGAQFARRRASIPNRTQRCGGLATACG